jgi:hypothetical protein
MVMSVAWGITQVWLWRIGPYYVNGNITGDAQGESLTDILHDQRNGQGFIVCELNGGIFKDHPSTLIQDHLTLHYSDLRRCGLRLFSNFSESLIGEETSPDYSKERQGFHGQSPSVSLFFAWGITLLGGIVFFCGYWNGNLNLKVNVWWWIGLTIAGALLFGYGLNALLDLSEDFRQLDEHYEVALVHVSCLAERNGGDFTTCFNNFSKFLYPGGLGGRSFLSSSILSFGGFDSSGLTSSGITPPPSPLGYSKSGGVQQHG